MDDSYTVAHCTWCCYHYSMLRFILYCCPCLLPAGHPATLTLRLLLPVALWAFGVLLFDCYHGYTIVGTCQKLCQAAAWSFGLSLLASAQEGLCHRYNVRPCDSHDQSSSVVFLWLLHWSNALAPHATGIVAAAAKRNMEGAYSGTEFPAASNSISMSSSTVAVLCSEACTASTHWPCYWAWSAYC